MIAKLYKKNVALAQPVNKYAVEPFREKPRKQGKAAVGKPYDVLSCFGKDLKMLGKSQNQREYNVKQINYCKHLANKPKRELD